MELITAEADALLERWSVNYADDPGTEREKLWLLALEREQIVAVAYSEAAVQERLSRLPVPANVRDLLRHALVWVWKDEALHTSYIRGLLLAEHRFTTAALAYGQQALGAISGWATAAKMHGDIVDAPLRYSIAMLLEVGGQLTGKLSKPLRDELQLGSFRRYCLFNAALETTAEKCYRRLAVISRDADERAVFAQIAGDEADHGAVFTILAEALGEDDRLVDDTTEEALIERIRAVSEWLLPAHLRSDAARPGSFASGAPVHIGRGDALTDSRTVLGEVLDDVGLADLVAANRHGRAPKVAIKVSFMQGYHRDDPSTFPDPALVDELAGRLRLLGCEDIAVVEGPNQYDSYFARRSVPEVADYLGYRSEHYSVVDAASDQVPHTYARGMDQSTLSATWREADLRIVVGKLRTNPSELGHLSLMSLEGMGGRLDSFVFAGKRIGFRDATMMLIDAAPPDLAIIDAYDHAADGPFGVMGCRRPPSPRRIYAGFDALTVDGVILRDMGEPDPMRSPLIRAAVHWFGGSPDPVAVRGQAGRIERFRHVHATLLSAAMAKTSYPVYIYASGSGHLFVPAMDTDAFPEKSPVGPVTRVVRRCAQLAFGLRPGDAA